MKTTYILSLAGVLLLNACGKGVVDVSNESYEPRIVIEGFVEPGKPVTNIRITRNFPIAVNLQRFDLVLDDATAKITDEAANASYPLVFHAGHRLEENYFEERTGNLEIKHGQAYTIDVRARVSGQDLHAYSTTLVPENGFKILGQNFEELAYRQKDENGDIIEMKLNLSRSPTSNFYLAVVDALNPTVDNFIYDNVFTDRTPEEVADDFNDFNHQIDWVQDTPFSTGETEMRLYWSDVWFYTDYRVIVYACDKNYRVFMQTHDDVQEDTGNFHEAQFEVKGDGIGFFGSAIADTAYFRIVK